VRSLGARKKPIESVDLESRLDDDLCIGRRRLEGELSRNPEIGTNVASRERVLELASIGEFGIARSLIMDQLSIEQNNEELLETMALLESYSDDEFEDFRWCESLIEINPENTIAISLRDVRELISSQEWKKAKEAASIILEIDGRNLFALKASANSDSSLGEWDKSSSAWGKIRKIRGLKEEERYEAARTFYNAKMFSKVIEIVPKEEVNDDNEVKLLELIARSYYNLRMDDEVLDCSNLILELKPESEIGLRSLSRSLIRLGRLTEAIPIIEEYCRVFPSSTNAWESLIETKLMMDKIEEARGAWDELRSGIGEEIEIFFTALEISLRFNWREEYHSIIQNEGKKFSNNAAFAGNIAEINLKLGDIGSAWGILSSNGIDPMESFLGIKFEQIMESAGANIEEIENASESGESLWITELVTREILRKAGTRRELRRGKKRCHLVSSSLDRGGAERQVAMTLKHIQGMDDFECFLAIHRVKSRQGVGTYFDDLGGLENKIFDLGGIFLEDSDVPGKEIIDANADILGLLDSGVKMKVMQLISHFANFQPDIVHAWQDETILTSCIAGALTGVPIVLGSARSLRPDEKTELHIRKRPYLRNCFREIFNYNCHYLSTNSIAGRNSYSEWIGMDKEEVIVNENGVDFEEIESGMERAEIEQRLGDFGFSEENKIVGGIFRLEAGKRPKLWIESFDEARKTDGSIRGIIVGGGRMENSVREWVSDSGLEEFVKIVGEVSDIGSWLSIMDVFLFTSVTEGLPNVLIEAQGFGVPVVSTRVGGVPEVVIDGKTGFIVETATREVLGESIIQIFSNENFNEFGVLSKKVARERFAVSEMAKRTVEMYSRVLPLPDGESLRGGEG